MPQNQGVSWISLENSKIWLDLTTKHQRRPDFTVKHKAGWISPQNTKASPISLQNTMANQISPQNTRGGWISLKTQMVVGSCQKCGLKAPNYTNINTTENKHNFTSIFFGFFWAVGSHSWISPKLQMAVKSCQKRGLKTPISTHPKTNSFFPFFMQEILSSHQKTLLELH